MCMEARWGIGSGPVVDNTINISHTSESSLVTISLMQQWHITTRLPLKYIRVEIETVN